MSRYLLNSPSFRFLQWRFGLSGASPETEVALERKLIETIDSTPGLDAVALLAFDGVHTADGHFDAPRTHLYVTNDYVIELARRHRKVLLAASVHPYRKDAVQELERCARAGAVLMKWLPIVQDFNPAHPKCIPFYEALAHFKMPLLCHTGVEHALPNHDKSTADPALLVPALERGVTVIMAHCGSRVFPWEPNFTPTFMRMAREYEHCYGDTSALNVPLRWYALEQCMADPVVEKKLIHGSDWPILAIPPFMKLGLDETAELMTDGNWMSRDVSIKRRLGMSDDYWHRGATVLGLTRD